MLEEEAGPWLVWQEAQDPRSGATAWPLGSGGTLSPDTWPRKSQEGVAQGVLPPTSTLVPGLNTFFTVFF